MANILAAAVALMITGLIFPDFLGIFNGHLNRGELPAQVMTAVGVFVAARLLFGMSKILVSVIVTGLLIYVAYKIDMFKKLIEIFAG